MSAVDIVILVILVWGAWQGWRRGLLKEVVSMAGFFVGLFIAYQFYDKFGEYLAPVLSGNPSVAKYLGYVLAFIVIWVVVPMVLGIVANVLTKSLKWLRLGCINSSLGLLVGVLKYVVLLSFVFCAMELFGIISQEKRDASHLYGPVTSLARPFFEGKRPLLPDRHNEEAPDTFYIDIHQRSARVNN